MKPFRSGGIWRDWTGEVRIWWRLAPMVLFCVVGFGLLVQISGEMREQRAKEQAELRERVRRIDERTERFEHSCSCGGQP